MSNLHSDLPTLDDCLERKEMVRRIGTLVAKCDPPHVFGVMGEWGSGKTSVLAQLSWYLTNEQPPQVRTVVDGASPDSVWNDWVQPEHVTVVWFESWRYQHEQLPIVALLNEIRQQLSWKAKARNLVEKGLEVAIRGALLSLEDLTKRIGFQASKIQSAGERWEQDHYAYSLPTQAIREHLEDALKQLLGETGPDEPDPRLVVIVDDLDRCEADAAYRLMEGIKIYLNLSNCVFVLGMNQRIVERAIAQNISKQSVETDESRRRAREYLEKLCQDIWHLPLTQDPTALLERLLTDKPTGGINTLVRQTLCKVCTDNRCLPPNARRIKALANVLYRFIEHTNYTQVLPDDGKNQRHAELIVLMASLYQYHPELYRRVEWDPLFFEALSQWAGGRPNDHDALQCVVRPDQPPAKSASTSDPTLTPELNPAHPDPEQGNILRVQSLIRKLGPVPEDEIRRYLLR